jgi:hypothetical protein
MKTKNNNNIESSDKSNILHIGGTWKIKTNFFYKYISRIMLFLLYLKYSTK